ncbi:protein kinase [Lysinibacillus sp. CTST325]
MNINVTAEVYRLGILIGLYSVQDVIKWADNVIERLDNPPYEVIEISLSSQEKPIDVCSKLKLFNGGLNNDDLPSKILLGLLNEYFLSINNVSDVFSMLFRLIDHLQLVESNKWIEVEMIYLSDAFYLADQNIYGDLNEVGNNLKNYLSQFEDYAKYLSI